jgi:hypothetical protein
MEAFFMKLTRTLIASFTLLAFAGCKTVKIKNGEVPNQYLSQAKKLVGTYKGDFEGVPGNLIVSVNGNKPVLTYTNKRGEDILNNNCHSEFGNLLEVTIKNENKNPTVSSTLFDFDAGGCSLMVRGRDASVDFKQTDKGMRINISILKDVYQHQVCSWVPGNPPHIPPSQSCHWEQNAVYLYGTFYRQ